MQHVASADYFRRRAAEELCAAAQASDERAAQQHRELARRYGDLVKSGVDGRRSDEDLPAAGSLPNEFIILP